jgi:FixJ family two-component response regulator
MADEIAAEVIIVDDDPSIQRALNRLLRVHGFSRRIFSNAQEFLTDRKPPPPSAACCSMSTCPV